MQSCELFPYFSKGGLLRVWQINYCEGGYERCQRYVTSCKGESPPAQMLPNGRLLSHWRGGG
jgi:hypothetical protein